jgi:hypothetical protein
VADEAAAPRASAIEPRFESDPGEQLPQYEAPAPPSRQRATDFASTGVAAPGSQLARASAVASRPAAPTTIRQGRPPLRLVAAPEHAGATATIARAEAGAERAAAAPSGIRRAPTSGSRLATATGATLSRGDEGYETVVFPRPSGLAFAPAVSLMRAAEDAAPAEAPAGAGPAAPQSSPAPAPAQGGGGGGGGGDIEEIYTQVIERLRRDLLADRERMGDLLGDLP